tara:strand:- start:33 stop:470 length:438 start_codon:yes stop_codon:yes gene_type:complete
MKKIILILITILTSTIITSQVRFNYIRWKETNEKHDSTGYIYYTSDPDTTLARQGLKACIIYKFDNEKNNISPTDIVQHYIRIYKTKTTKDEVIYFGKNTEERYKITYSKKYGDFIIKKRALFPKNEITLFFHRDYSYYEELTAQ